LDRAFRPLPESLADGKKRIVEPRIGFLEKAVSDSAPYIQWASPLFQPSSYDGVVRRWGLWQSICTAEEKPDIIPSTQLLAAAMLHLDTPQQAQDKIHAELARFKRKVCGDSYIPQSSKPVKIAEGLEITEGIYGISQRIVYNMPWVSPQSIAEKWMLRYSLRDYDKETQKKEVILTVFSAQPYLDSPEGGTFKDKIVLIGSSYSDGGDLHSTPLGTMPGGLVIINALHSLLQYKPSFAWNKGWAVLLIVVVSILLTFVKSFWLMFLSGIGVILLALISAFLFVEGVWINFALPLLAIHIPKMVIRFNEIARNVESQQKKSAKLERKIKKSVEESLTKQIKQLVAKLDLSKLAKDIEQSNKKEEDSETGSEKSESLQWLKQQGNKLYQWIKKLFSYLLPSRKNLIINLFLGLGVAFGLLYFNDSPWLMDAEDASMDWFMQINQNIIQPIQKDDIPPVVVLDIDDETYYDWGRPLFTPRRRLKNMIAAAVEAKARFVIVDLDVNQRMPVAGPQLHPDDQALKDYLANYIIECKRKIDNSVCPRIILKRTFSTQSSPVPILWAGFLDDVVQGAPYVQWASALFDSTGNKVVRRWKLWQPVCTADNQPEVVPSIELLAMSLVKEDCMTQDVQNALRSFLPEDCDRDYASPQKSLPETFNLCGLPINTKDRWGINQRIMYPMSWLDSVTDEVDMPVLTILSAQPYTESPPQAKLKTLTDSIVILGKSYREGSDIHSTPLGDMSGALIIVNAIHSVLQYEKIELSPIVGLLTIALFIVIMSILFGIFPSCWGMIVSGIFIIFVLLPFTMVFFHYGMWFNIALPLIAITLYQVVAKYNQSPVQEQ
jgi:CHASE2 domain-containing sensor protein